MKKAQSSVEYLMTYGWAILVIIGVGLVIWRMGVLDLGEDTTPGKRGFSQVMPLDWKASSTGELYVIITNEAGIILNLSEAADGTEASIIAGGTAGPCTGGPPELPVAVFRPAQTIELTFTGCPITEPQGDYYRAEVSIVYVNPASGIEHVSHGRIWGGIE